MCFQLFRHFQLLRHSCRSSKFIVPPLFWALAPFPPLGAKAPDFLFVVYFFILRAMVAEPVEAKPGAIQMIC